MRGVKDFDNREIKFAPVALETVTHDGVFEGYASLFNTMDLGRDIVRPGAFKKYLQTSGGGQIKLLYQHDPREPIGIWEEVTEDRKGLHVRGRLLPEIRRASEVLTLMRLKALDGLSIGFKAKRTRPLRGKAARELLEVELYEISIVTFPMHPAARAVMVNSNGHNMKTNTSLISNGLPTIREFERWLTREAGFTRRQARLAINKGFKSLAFTQDAEPASPQSPLIQKGTKAAELNQAAHLMRRAARET